jgi:spore maturation protein CgeB
MRVFDILACGGFVLAEHSDALAELFVVGEEIDSWRTPDELVDKVDWYLNNRAVAVAMAQRGCRAVSERHTIQQRVRMMLKLSGVGAVARV